MHVCSWEHRAAAFAGASVEAMAAIHTELAAKGVGMTTLAYACVHKDGRTFENQLVLTDRDTQEKLRVLCNDVHEHGAAICVQLTRTSLLSELGIYLNVFYAN